MKCTYKYQGQELTKEEILDVLYYFGEINNEKVSQARKWLKETMGMSDHEIRIISGAIDNKSFARILEDGSILLSDTMEEGAHYHEAFHRVVRMFLTGEQVKNLFNEFRARPDAKRLIARYGAIYKGVTEEEVIEEILAEEFREYALSQYEVTNPEQKSLFERILEFFATLFDKNQTRELYDNIIAAKYNGTPSVYTIKAADMLIGNREFSVDKRREIVDAVNIFFLQSVLDNATIYELMDGNINTTEAYKDAIDAVILSIRDLARKTNDINLAQDLVAIVNDVYKKVGDKTVFNPESVLIKEHQKFYKAMNISFELVEEDADPDKLDEVAEEGGESSKDQAYDKVSFEFDSKTNIGRAIKLLLAALPSEELSKTYGLYVPISWTESTALLLNELAGLPAEIDIFVNRLSELSHKYPWLKDLIEYLGGYSEGKSFTYPQMKLRNEFVQSFGKYKYDFLIQMFKGDDIYFTDANRFSMIERNIQEWQNNLGLLYEDGAQLLERLKELRGSKASIQEIVQALGMDNILLNPSVLSEEINTSGKDKTVTSAIFEIADIIVKSLEAGNPLTRLYETNIGSFGIRGTLRKISELQSDFQIPVDIQLQNAVGKRIYPINLNTFQTITLNYLNHIAAKVNELGLEYDEALELLKETMPHLINVNTVIEDEMGTMVNSLYLNEILHGKPIRLHITDGSRITGGRGKSFHELTETDLLAANFNGTLKGFFPSVKHSDRSTIFAYSMQGGKLFQDVDTELGAQDAYVSLMHNYILNEVNRIKALEIGLGADIEFYNQNAKDFTIFSFLSDGVKQRLLAGADVSIADRELEVQFKGLTNELIVKLEEWGLLEDTDNGRPVGISKELWNNAKGSKEDKIKALASAAVLNTFVAHLEETKLFVGDLAFYKSAEDSYKRFKMQSSTGDLTIVDAENNKFIHEVNQRDTVQVYNPRTKEVEVFKYTDKKEVDGTMSEIVLEEVSSFSAEFLKKEVTFGAETSRILGKTTGTELEHMIAQSMYDSYSNSSFSEEDKLSFIRKKVNQFTEKYRKINENDGQSYLNLFGWREFMHRAGKWTERLENLFQVELAIAKLPADKSIEDTEIYLSPSGTEFSANAREGWAKFKVFDLSETDVSAKELLSEFMESGTVLKPQYTGPVYLDKKGLVEPSANSLNVIGGRKTSYFVLFPSIIKGTNLQLLNTTMLRNGLDAVHFGSAAKFGRKHSKSIAKEWELSEEIQKNGLRLYNDEGEFNDQLIDETADLFKSYLDYRFMKYQLNIKNKPKEKIKNSTQSMKILIGTIFDKGIPRDISLQEHEWNSLSELEKREMSSLYNLYKNYTTNLSDIVLDGITAIKEELKYDDTLASYQELSVLVDIIKGAAEERNSPQNILDAIELFASSPILETLPNKSKVENILFSLVSNRVINIKRTGDSKPQVAVSGFEDIFSKRETRDKKVIGTSALKFYRVENGKVMPAEIMIPFPKERIEEVLAKYNTTNIATAIELLNKDLATGKERVLFKGLRIPNQQFSSNDVFEVKKFFLPTMEAFAIVPSELAVKTGSDFDIDKLQMYFKSGLFESAKNNTSSDKLLDAEIQILLHPRNVHYLLAPVIDDILSVDAVKELLDGKLDKTKYPEIMTMWKNIVKHILYVGGKMGVGQIATDITGHSVAMVDMLVLNRMFNTEEEVFETKIPFEGHENDYTMYNVFDDEGNAILETLSALITSQVDVGNNPYPVEIGINNQTLNVITFMLRRGMNPIKILKFMSQPIIQEYLRLQRINESMTYDGGGLDLGKQDLLDKVKRLVDNNRAETSELIDEVQLDNYYNQHKMIDTFINILEQVKAFARYKKDITADTKTLKDMQAYDNTEINYDQLTESGIMNTGYRESGFLAPFIEARKLYSELFREFFLTKEARFEEVLDALKDTVSSFQRGADLKVLSRNILDNDFILYAVQNYHPLFKKHSFDTLFKGSKSLPKEINAIKKDPAHPLHNNYAIQHMFVMLKNTVDELTGEKVDNVRLFERMPDARMINDLHDAIIELRENPQYSELYEKIVVFGFYQAGLDIGPFQLGTFLPVDLRHQILEEAVAGIPSNIDFSDFATKFLLNNLRFTPRASRKRVLKSGLPFYKTRYNMIKKREIIRDVNDPKVEYPLLGDRFFKRYNTEFGAMTQLKNTPMPSDEMHGLEEPIEEVLDQIDDTAIGSYTKVLEGDIWSYPGVPVITTNLGGIHGAGLASQAKNKGFIKYKADGDFADRGKVVTFPVKKVWSDVTDMELLQESADKLIELANSNTDKQYLLPLIGLGHGEGSISTILPIIADILNSTNNIKLVLPTAQVDRGKKGTARTDSTLEKMPEIKSALEKLLNNSNQTEEYERRQCIVNMRKA